ncbi:YtxH domain-containing protein [Aneurinibacillus sp. BA2021]|nr:YtxH domain-containing protein [Aneurinibacillus sp. BA2021]
MDNQSTNKTANSYNWYDDNSTSRAERTSMVEDARNTDWTAAETKAAKKSMNKLLWGTVAGGVLGATAVILADKATREDVFRGTSKAKDKTMEFMSSTLANPNAMVTKIEEASNRVAEMAEETKENMQNATASSHMDETNAADSSTTTTIDYMNDNITTDRYTN